MNLQLKRLRKLAGYRTQDEFAAVLGVPERRYASWERGEVMMSLEQAYHCAVALNCTIDEIAGLSHPTSPRSDPEHASLDEYYESMGDDGRAALVESARFMSGNYGARARHGRA
ncbi:MAG: helix-turn-helix transcriptional regulator [Gordonibacter sp.]